MKGKSLIYQGSKCNLFLFVSMEKAKFLYLFPNLVREFILSGFKKNPFITKANSSSNKYHVQIKELEK